MTETLLKPTTVPARRGADWFAEGFRLFKLAPGVWLAITVILIIAFSLAEYLPTSVSLLSNLLVPALAGGLMLGCDAQQRGQPLRVEHLWIGLTGPKAGKLIMLGVLALIGTVLSGLALTLTVGGSVVEAILTGGGLETAQLGIGLLLGLLIALLIALPVTMGLWLAPALIVLSDMEPWPAMKASFQTFVVNIPAMLVNSLVLIVLGLVASIPLFLGWLVLIPVLTASIYFTYRDAFPNEARAKANLPPEIPA